MKNLYIVTFASSFLLLSSCALVQSQSDGQRACSCYTFEDGGNIGKSWTRARKSCKYNNKYLVAMETIQEWEFINKTIKDRTAFRVNEWHIGLLKNKSTGKWTWINGKPLSINKWQRNKPGKDESYAVIAKEWPIGSYGLFNSIKGGEARGWICEKETDNCQGVCMRHNSAPTTTMPPRISTTHSTETIKSSSAKSASITDGLAHSSDSTTPVTFPRKNAQQSNKDDSTVYIVAASLGTVLFLSLTALSVAVAFLLKYKKRRVKDTRGNNAISLNAVRGEAEELILNPAERGRQQRLSNEKSEYADLVTHTMTTPNGVTYASLLKSEGGNNFEESPATDLFPRSGKEEEPLAPDYVNQIPRTTYENI